jgi:glutathione S-transferase
MITVFGEGRGFRVVWLLEEMGIPYRLRPVDLLAGVEKDAEFLAVNPAGFIPAIQDGNVTMVESIAIMEYLMGRYGPTQLAPDPRDPAFPAYQQFLHLGEAGLHLLRRRRPQFRAGSPAAELECRPSTGGLREPAGAGDAAARALAISCRRDVHGGRYFGDLRPRVGSKSWRRHPRRGGASLCGPNRRTRSLQAGHGNLSGHKGMGG